MPDQPVWYARVSEILATLEESQAVLLDRFSIEKLFGVSRRTAIRIMDTLGGYQVGRTFVVPREEMVRALQRLAKGDAGRARQRKQRIWHVLEQERMNMRGRAVEIPAPPQPALPEIAHLPPGVDLTPGTLTIQFDAPVDLLQKLVALSQALANDYETFERRYSRPGAQTAGRLAV